LSNMTVEMLNSNIQFNQIGEFIDHIISTDQAKTFKPDPRAYQLGVETLGYTKQNILFTAFASWDAAGAKWFGYPTVWVNRFAAPIEELSVKPDASAADLSVVEPLFKIT
ncbi:MAG: HAD-IA family hydrolase, partial [Gammaproteobacteria bacterium]|nr:HAD-IA family hydrolase [Gammaproteobacteria bacterium]